MKQELNLLDGYTPTNDLLNDAKQIIEVSQKAAYRAVNLALVQRNWLLGYRIAQEELKGEGRSEYGTAVIRKLAKELTAEYGKGFDYSSLYKHFRFYKLYPEIVDSLSPQSQGTIYRSENTYTDCCNQILYHTQPSILLPVF